MAAQLAAAALPAEPPKGASEAATSPKLQASSGGGKSDAGSDAGAAAPAVSDAEQGAAQGSGSKAAAAAAAAPRPPYLDMQRFMEAWREPATLEEQMRLVYGQRLNDRTQRRAAAAVQGQPSMVGSTAEAVRLAAFYVSSARGMAGCCPAVHACAAPRAAAAVWTSAAYSPAPATALVCTPRRARR